MKKINKEDLLNEEIIIYPLIYDGGLLFKKLINTYYLFKDNKLKTIEYDKLKEDLYYPENVEELLAIKNALDFIYQRLSTSQIYSDLDDFFKIIKKIILMNELENEKLIYNKLKLKFKEK